MSRSSSRGGNSFVTRKDDNMHHSVLLSIVLSVTTNHKKRQDKSGPEDQVGVHKDDINRLCRLRPRNFFSTWNMGIMLNRTATK